MMFDTFRARSLRRANTGAAVVALPRGVAPAPIDKDDDEQKYRPIAWPLVRRMLRELGAYRKQYALGIGVGLIHVLCDMSGPKFIEALINYCTAFAHGQVPGATRGDAIRQVLTIIAAWTGVFVCSVFLQRICIIIMTRAGETVQFSL